MYIDKVYMVSLKEFLPINYMATHKIIHYLLFK